MFRFSGSQVFSALVKLYMVSTRKKHLIPFWETLSHMGRPASIAFPPELIEQGWALLLSGVNNTLAVQSNPKWVWPYWVEQQIAPTSPSFIPTGVNIMTVNLSHRNWTSLGLKGCKNEIMVDPVGMLTLSPYGWSVFPYIKIDSNVYAPPRMHGRVSQKLKDGVYPSVLTHYDAVDWLDWNSEVFAFAHKGKNLVAYIHSVKNLSTEKQKINFGISLRPYNSLTLGPLNRLTFKNGMWKANGKSALLILQEPDLIKISNRYHGDPIFYQNGYDWDDERVSSSGIIAGICEYKLELAPGQAIEITCIGSLDENQTITDFHSKRTQVMDSKIARDLFDFEWKVEEKKSFNIHVPDKTMEKAFNAVKNRFFVFDDVDYFTPGTFFYHQPWIRDSVYMMMACDKMGWPEMVKNKFKYILNTQNRDGFFRSQTGEWDSNGQVMYGLLHHHSFYQTMSQAEKYLPKLLLGVRWLQQQVGQSKVSNSQHFGLLPAGFSAEHFGPNDHYFWDNFWSIAGIRIFLDVSKEQNWKVPAWVGEFYEQYHSDLLSAMSTAFEKELGEGLPCSPYRKMDSAAIGNLVAIEPLELFSPWANWVEPTLDLLWENNCSYGLFFQQIVHTGLNVYLSIQMAKVFLLRGDKRWHQIYQSVIKYATPTWTWPEAIHPLTKGGCMGDGDHGWAAAEFLSLVRDIYVKDTREGIHLGLGLQLEWFANGEKIVVDRAMTRYGRLSYSLTSSVLKTQFNWDYRPHTNCENIPLWLHIPKEFDSPSDVIEAHHNFDHHLICLSTLMGSRLLSKSENHDHTKNSEV